MGLFSSIKDVAAVAAPIAGAYFGGPMGAQIGSAVGGMIAGGQQAKQAGETAAQYDARMRQLGQQGFFKPVAMKTLYGQSEFEVDPVTGAVTSAGYTPSESVQEQQGKLGVMMGQGLDTAEQAIPFAQQFSAPAQGLFDIGQDYIASSPEQARNEYMQRQMAALRPYDIEEEERLSRTAFGRGQGGLSVGVGGNPLLKQLQESRNRRNLQLAAGAEDAAQQAVNFGSQQVAKSGALMGTGYDVMQGSLAPYQSYLANQAKLEELAQQPLTMGANLGATAMTGQQYGADMASQGSLGIAQQQLAASQMKNDAMQGLFGNKDLLDGLGNYFNPAQADIEERIITPRGPDLRKGGLGVVSGGYSGGMFGDISSPMSAYGF
jgi:hypothetical protein